MKNTAALKGYILDKSYGYAKIFSKCGFTMIH